MQGLWHWWQICLVAGPVSPLCWRSGIWPRAVSLPEQDGVQPWCREPGLGSLGLALRPDLGPCSLIRRDSRVLGAVAEEGEPPGCPCC